MSTATLVPVFAALGDETRWSILSALGEGDASASTLAGRLPVSRQAIAKHLAKVLALPMIDVPAIRARKLHVALDCVRGAGGWAIPPLLEMLGCRVSGINLETDGRFPRPP